MKKFFNYWLLLIVLIWAVFQTPNFNTTLQQTPISVQNTSINEEDFFNTMFLKSEFFENWSDTNYFINLTLKTSKPLKYSKNWYIDYLKDIYSSGVSYQKPSSKFLDLIKRPKYYLSQIFDWDKFLLGREINWYASDSKQYLKNIYEKFLIMIGSGMKFYQSQKSETWGKFTWEGWSDNDFKAIAQKWDNRLSSFNYFPYHKFSTFDINNWDYDSLSRSLQKTEEIRKTYQQSIRYVNMSGVKVYSQKEIVEFRKKLLNFLNEYSDIVIDELIRVQNGGSCDYDNVSDGTERILFSFENVNIKDTLTLNTYCMSLTIDNNDHNLIRSGTLSFINKQDKSYQDGHLNFVLDFVLLANGKYSSEIETFSYEKGLKVVYSQLSGFLNLNEFLKQFFRSDVWLIHYTVPYKNKWNFKPLYYCFFNICWFFINKLVLKDVKI